MAEIRIGPRLTLGEQMSRNPAFKGRLLAMEFRSAGGNLLRASDVIEKRSQTIEKLALTINGLRASQITIPGMIDISDKVRIMKGEVPVGLFGQVMEGYEIKGHNADKLRAILADPAQENSALTFVNLFDAREFAARLSNLTGRKFRVQTEDEWLAGKGRLQGNNWTWTETKYSDSSFVLRHLSLVNRSNDFPEYRYSLNAVRLVEDITP